MKQRLKVNKELKEELIKNLIKCGALFSYDPSKVKDNLADSIVIEHTLKYADLQEILMLFKIYPKNYIKKVWEKTMKYDKRFIKLNFYLARIFFNLGIEIKELKKESDIKRYRFKNFTF